MLSRRLKSPKTMSQTKNSLWRIDPQSTKGPEQDYKILWNPRPPAVKQSYLALRKTGHIQKHTQTWNGLGRDSHLKFWEKHSANKAVYNLMSKIKFFSDMQKLRKDPPCIRKLLEDTLQQNKRNRNPALTIMQPNLGKTDNGGPNDSSNNHCMQLTSPTDLKC